MQKEGLRQLLFDIYLFLFFVYNSPMIFAVDILKELNIVDIRAQLKLRDLTFTQHITLFLVTAFFSTLFHILLWPVYLYLFYAAGIS